MNNQYEQALDELELNRRFSFYKLSRQQKRRIMKSSSFSNRVKSMTNTKTNK